MGGKCAFGRDEAEFLGLRVTEHGYEHTKARKQAILDSDMQRPVDAHQLKSLLGFANYLRTHCGADYAVKMLGHHFHLHTDHRNAVSLWSLQAPKVQRWRCKLADFDFTIHHVPGIENKSQVAINQELVDQIILHHNSLVGHVRIDEPMFRMEQAGYGNQLTEIQETSHDTSDSTASMCSQTVLQCLSENQRAEA
jgi:hypothetical protein